ncbi:hypothetical protein NLJ89_g7229 [Agrocybe chaxingu]|uniref:Uncharacterized protein n=1 Tax=Agrocybe chaxingu TaxID=84603 RepID=A0A9W8JZH4_9AGAR|nr:hypothetical protein NLJ89_g7229 [Agrocybe chaxingu]
MNPNSARPQRSLSVSRNTSPISLMSQRTVQPSMDQGGLYSKALSTVNETSARLSKTVCSPEPQKDEPTLATLRSLQIKLSKTLATLAPVNLSNALGIAQSAKEQCTAALSTAKRAHTLAQQAVTSAQESMNVAQECLIAVQSIQNRVDEAVDTVQSTTEQGHANSQAAGSRVASNPKSVTDQPLPPSSAVSDPSAMTLEQASDVKSEIEKIRKQNAERKRRAEEEIRNRREVEERLELENKRIRAQAESQEAELARVRKERIEAEEEELVRQQKETQELERQQELERIRQEPSQFRLLQQSQQEETARKEAEEKDKTRQAGMKLEARLLTEQDQKRREIQERDELAKRLQVERRRAEEQRQQQLREEQEARRREIQVRKQRANEEAAARIQTERANKQTRAYDPKNSASPSNQMQLLPAMPSQNNIPPPLSTEIGNVVSKKTVTNANKTPFNRLVLSLCPLPRNLKFPNDSVCPPIDSFKDTNVQFSTPPPPSAGLSDIAVDSVGSDIGNVLVIPRSQLPLLSPETRKANLRPFMHAHAIVTVQSIKPDPDEVKPTVKLERSSPPPLSQTNVNPQTKVPPRPEIKIGRSKVQARQPSNDIPRLSLPSPPASVKSHAAPAPTQLKSNAPRAPNDVKVAPLNFKPVELNGSEKVVKLHTSVNASSWALQKAPIRAKAGHEGVNIGNAPAQTLRMQIPPSLPKRPTPLSIPIGSPSVPPCTKTSPASLTPTGINPDEASLMGPAAAISGGWSQQNATQDEPFEARQRSRSRRTSIDHYSPSPSPVNIRNGGDLRPRVPSRGDHYSPPRRGPEPLPPSRDDYRRRSPPMRRGQGSASNSQEISPNLARSPTPRDDRRSLSQDVGPRPSTVAGRKRFRDEEYNNAPPPRRSRYGECTSYNDSNTFGGPSNSDLNWSRSAVYGRSPSPETRATPLALRMGPEPVNTGKERHNLYRPSHGNDYWPHARNQCYSPPAHFEGDSYRFDNYRPNYRTPPELLTRFTDSDKGSQNNRPRPRVPRPTGRGGSNYSPSNRISNRGQALIDRMKVDDI